MLAEKVEHRGRPLRGPSLVMVQTKQPAHRIAPRIDSAIRIGAATDLAYWDAFARGVDDHVLDIAPDHAQLRRQLLAVGADSRNVAAIVDMHCGHPRIEDSHLGDVRRRAADRHLTARIIECAERVRSRIDRYRRDVGTVERIEQAHRRAVGPAGYIDASGVDFAGTGSLCDEAIDLSRVGVSRIDSVADPPAASRTVLTIPVAPSATAIVGPGIVVSSVAALRREHDKARPRGI